MRVGGTRHFHEFARLGDRVWPGEHLDVVDRGGGCVPLRRFASSPNPDLGSLVTPDLVEEPWIDENISLGVDARIWWRLEVRKVLDLLGHDGRLPLQTVGRHVTDGLRDSEGQGLIQLHIWDYPIRAMDRSNQALDDTGALVHD